MDPQQVIVTGGAGYIGSHTVVELCAAGFQPILIDDFSNSKPEVLNGLESITGFAPICHQVDCTNEAALLAVFQKTLQAGPIAGVIHFAAFKAVGESTEKPLAYFQNNIGSTANLLKVMGQCGVFNLVFSSSCTVYGQPTSIPVDEKAPILPAESPYGYTKQVCERLIQDVQQSDDQWNAALLRYFNPIGAHPSSEIGELSLGHPNNLIPYLTQAAAELRAPLTVFGNDYPTDDGTCVRDYIHVVDLAKAHVAALKWLKKEDRGCEAINLGTGKGHSVLNVIESFKRATGVNVPYHIGPRRPGDITATYADISKAKTILNWECELSLETALNDAWRWQKKCVAAG